MKMAKQNPLTNCGPILNENERVDLVEITIAYPPRALKSELECTVKDAEIGAFLFKQRTN